MGQTKTRKLLLTWLETKYNVTVLWYNIMQFFTRKTRGCNILFNSANKEIFYVLSVPVIMWQVTTVTEKKKLYLRLLGWMPYCFSCSMYMLVSHACSNQKVFHSWKIIDSPHQSRPHKKILFPRYIISQSSGGPQLRQLINQRSKTTSIFRLGLLGPGMTIDKNMNSGLIHIPSGKL